MSLPTKELMKLVLEQKIAHGGNVPLRYMMDNVFVRTDPAGNIKMDKEKSTERIDGAVAIVMALDRAIRNQGTVSESIYNDRRSLFDRKNLHFVLVLCAVSPGSFDELRYVCGTKQSKGQAARRSKKRQNNKTYSGL